MGPAPLRWPDSAARLERLTPMVESGQTCSGIISDDQEERIWSVWFGEMGLYDVVL